MIRVRMFEDKCAELYTQEKIRGFLHLYDGEEAIATGVIPVLTPDDRIVATYREHGHALLRGVPMKAVMAEMYGKRQGCSGGRGGSMHLFDAKTNFYGGNAIVGGGLPLAVGLALADRMRREKRVTACFFGEGAVAEGEFHESMNLAALWGLPVLFVCENNRYAMGTALDLSESETDIHAKAAVFKIAAEAIDGMDVVAVEAAARRAIHAIHETGKPYFLECRTFRFRRALDVRRPALPQQGGSRGLAQERPDRALPGLAPGQQADPPGRHRENRGRRPRRDRGSRRLRRGRHLGAGRGPDPACLRGGGPMTDASPAAAPSAEITYREAVKQAIRDAMSRDERVFLMGEDVGRYGGCYAVSKGLLDEFGPERIRDTPLSESGFTGAGIGAAMAGMRPIVELMTVNFSLLALDQILNSAATVRHMSGGQFGVPLVIRMATGAGRQLAAQHSHSLEGWYAHIPGIKVLAPATIEDARGMLWTALEDPDPVLIFENVMLYNMTGSLIPDAGPVEISRAAVRRPGKDVSLITYGGSLWKTLDAAAELAKGGIEAEVVDLRSLRPLDDATIMASVAKTRHAVVIDEGWRSGSLSAEISARIMEQAFWSLDAPVGRVCSAEVPIPYPSHLEQAAIPQAPAIVAAARAALGR